jgi:hypothetical protein
VVLEADGPIEPRLVETAGGLTVAFPDVSPRGWTGTRTIRDGLLATAELGEARGAAALHLAQILTPNDKQPELPTAQAQKKELGF